MTRTVDLAVDGGGAIGCSAAYHAAKRGARVVLLEVSGKPLLGPVEAWDGLLLATGHFRNAVLLSAVTGEIVADLALGEEPPADVSPFPYESHLSEEVGMR